MPILPIILKINFLTYLPSSLVFKLLFYNLKSTNLPALVKITREHEQPQNFLKFQVLVVQFLSGSPHTLTRLVLRDLCQKFPLSMSEMGKLILLSRSSIYSPTESFMQHKGLPPPASFPPTFNLDMPPNYP